MEIMDKASGKIYSICNYDGDIGAPDYMGDIIGNTGYIGIVYDYDAECYVSDMDTIQWWLDYVEDMRDMSERYETIVNTLRRIAADDDDAIDVSAWECSLADAVSDAQGCDYDQHASGTLKAIADWIDEHVLALYRDELVDMIERL